MNWAVLIVGLMAIAVGWIAGYNIASKEIKQLKRVVRIQEKLLENKKPSGMTPVWIYRWENGMVMTFDGYGRQMPDLQGCYTRKLYNKLIFASDEGTKWFGFGEEGPLKYSQPSVEVQLTK